MKRLILSALMTFMLASSPAQASNNVLSDMFAWWNGAIKSENGFTSKAFSRYFTDTAEININNHLSVKGVENMATHFRRIQDATDYVEIMLPFEESFKNGDKIFTYHLIKAREKDSENTTTSHIMGYAIIVDGRIDYIHFLDIPQPENPDSASK